VNTRETLARLRNGFLMLAAILVAGTTGFVWIENLPPLQAFYVTLLAVSTLGFGQFVPGSTGGILWTSGLIFVGVGTLYYLLGTFAEAVIETSLGTRHERRMERQIAKMNNHYIVCGYGLVGYHVARELHTDGQPFVIIDNDSKAVEAARGDGFAAILGDATEERVLQQAGIERAAGLLVTTSSDAVNVLIILTARSLKETLHIIARASSETAESKLIKAGANKVLAPAVIGGQRMAALALRPTTADVLTELVQSQNQHSWIDEAKLDETSPLIGETLATARLHQRTGATVIAMRHADGRIVTNPASHESFQPGDILISVGDNEQLQRLAQLARPAEEHRIREEDTSEIVGSAHR
jgi:voltage-gated potassium channel